MRFTIAIARRHPGFDVIHAPFSLAHVAGADLHDAIGELERLQDRLAVGHDLFVQCDVLGVVGFVNNDLLDLVELVDAIQPGRILARGAGFAAKAGAGGA